MKKYFIEELINNEWKTKETFENKDLALVRYGMLGGFDNTNIRMVELEFLMK
jgi:hypothetical protein